MTLSLRPTPLARRPDHSPGAWWRRTTCVAAVATLLAAGFAEASAAPTPSGTDTPLVGAPKRGREAAARRTHATPVAVSTQASSTDSPATLVQTPVNEQTVRVDLGGGGVSRSLTLPRGKSAVIELPVDAREIGRASCRERVSSPV